MHAIVAHLRLVPVSAETLQSNEGYFELECHSYPGEEKVVLIGINDLPLDYPDFVESTAFLYAYRVNNNNPEDLVSINNLPAVPFRKNKYKEKSVNLYHCINLPKILKQLNMSFGRLEDPLELEGWQPKNTDPQHWYGFGNNIQISGIDNLVGDSVVAQLQYFACEIPTSLRLRPWNLLQSKSRRADAKDIIELYNIILNKGHWIEGTIRMHAITFHKSQIRVYIGKLNYYHYEVVKICKSGENWVIHVIDTDDEDNPIPHIFYLMPEFYNGNINIGKKIVTDAFGKQTWIHFEQLGETSSIDVRDSVIVSISNLDGSVPKL